jgi:hypothetical protein
MILVICFSEALDKGEARLACKAHNGRIITAWMADTLQRAVSVHGDLGDSRLPLMAAAMSLETRLSW